MSKKRPQRTKHIPQRTCVVCRQEGDKRGLIRLVRGPDGRVAVDPTGKQSGRGAYLCQQPDCWEKALKQPQLLNRALNTSLDEADREAIARHKPVAAKE